MASIKNLKKDLNYTIASMIENCVYWELENESKGTEKSEAIIDEAITLFDQSIEKINAYDKKAASKYFHDFKITLGEKLLALESKMQQLSA